MGKKCKNPTQLYILDGNGLCKYTHGCRLRMGVRLIHDDHLQYLTCLPGSGDTVW